MRKTASTIRHRVTVQIRETFATQKPTGTRFSSTEARLQSNGLVESMRKLVSDYGNIGPGGVPGDIERDMGINAHTIFEAILGGA